MTKTGQDAIVATSPCANVDSGDMTARSAPAAEVAPGVARFRDTCNVYVLRAGRDAVLVDFGAGAVLDHLDELGVDRVTDVLLTHHHRDQLQGLARASAADIRIWAPPFEAHLIADADVHWQERQIENDYDLRQDRFSLLESVPVTGTVAEYRTRRYGEVEVFTLPTPGHTPGSVSYLVDLDGRRLAFTGDLLYAPGKVWSLAATQWTYSGVEGQRATIFSSLMLGDRTPDVLLPSHGEPMEDATEALSLTRSRMQELIDLRLDTPGDVEGWMRRPWVALSPHFLRNRSSFAHSYALLSESGAALMVDWGYDLSVVAWGYNDPAARRPLLESIDVLRREFGVERVEAVVTTHYHDDHVAGLNLLRDVEGTEVWAPENVAPILEDPTRHDLPCLWFEPIPVDRHLVLGTPIRWREYELTPHALPGHTLYAAAIAFEVDGRRVVAYGDQQAVVADRPDGPDNPNYQYRNRFSFDDFVRSAELFRTLRPDLLVGGHWPPREVTDEYLERMVAAGRRVSDLHHELLPLDVVDFGAEGFGARIAPYRSRVTAGDEVRLDVTVRNPFDSPAIASVRLAVPRGWTAEPEKNDVDVAALGEDVVTFRVTTAGPPARRVRVAADLTVGGVVFGQQAEALVDVG
jgi:glyoxylase-like metal-dependent hydrolase (beta-lactamase superfamily II)